MESKSNRLDSKDLIYDVFFQLIKSGLGISNMDVARMNSLGDKDWEYLFKLSCNHEVAALIADSFSRDAGVSVPIEVRLKFLGMQEIAERTYEWQLNVLEDLLEFFNVHEIPTMIFKGLSLSRYYPHASHRKHGDVDIYQFGYQPQSDYIVANKLGLVVRKYMVSHHTNYKYRDLSIENHYHFITTYYGGLSLGLESVLENFLDETVCVKIRGKDAQFPNPNFNAVYLVCHSAGHFRESKVSIRQMIDWMLFLRNEYENVDWAYVQRVYDKYNLTEYVNAINGILIDQLDMPQRFAYKYVKNERLERKILKDTLMFSANDSENRGVLGAIGQEWYQFIISGWKYHIFKQSGTLKMLEKLWFYIRHPEDYKEKIVNHPNM